MLPSGRPEQLGTLLPVVFGASVLVFGLARLLFVLSDVLGHERQNQMESSISLLGTSHRLQGASKAEHIQHVDDPGFRRYLREQLETKRFDFVFEEATEFGPTIAEGLTKQFLGEGQYLDVDPHPRNRAKFGIPALREEHTPINPYGPDEGFVQHEDLDGQGKREELWVRRIQGQSFKCALLICGYLHTLSLSFRLQSAGISVVQTSIYMPFIKLGA